MPSILRATMIVRHASRTLADLFTASMRPAISSRSGSLVPARLAVLQNESLIFKQKVRLYLKVH